LKYYRIEKVFNSKKKAVMYDSLHNNIVVIGGNAAGLAAASQARRKNPDINITVL
jgi:NADPH-dependent 2,4-dienoyl-CoA reductase/sulfur reductase-like enzyme